MKKLFLLLTLAAFLNSAQAQKCSAKNVPAPVMDAFNKNYPDTKKCHWGKDSANYQVSFYNGKAPVAVTYSAGGKRIITEMQMPVEDLPQAVSAYVQKHYPDEIFQEVAQITDAAQVITYEVQVKDLDLVFDAKGNFITSMKCYE